MNAVYCCVLQNHEDVDSDTVCLFGKCVLILCWLSQCRSWYDMEGKLGPLVDRYHTKPCQTIPCQTIPCQTIPQRNATQCNTTQHNNHHYIIWPDLTWPDMTWPDITWHDMFKIYISCSINQTKAGVVFRLYSISNSKFVNLSIGHINFGNPFSVGHIWLRYLLLSIIVHVLIYFVRLLRRTSLMSLSTRNPSTSRVCVAS